MFCFKCGKELPEGSGFCFNCGAKIEEKWIEEQVAQEPAAPVQAQAQTPIMPAYYSQPMYTDGYSAKVKKPKAKNPVWSIIIFLVIVAVTITILIVYQENAEEKRAKNKRAANRFNDWITTINRDVMMGYDFGPSEYNKYSQEELKARAEAEKKYVFDNIYPNKNFRAKETFFEDQYVTVTIDIYDKSTKKYVNYLMFLFKNSGGTYKLCGREDIVARWRAKYKCNACNGQGGVTSGSSTCGVCAGTGQMYVSNLYYDASMGWQGGYTVCSGCAGTGRGSYKTCKKCEGSGLRKP